MSERTAALRDYMAGQHAVLMETLAPIIDDEDALARPAWADGQGWTVGQLIAHLVWAAGGMLRSAPRYIENTGAASLPGDFDLDAYNATGVRRLAGKTPRELFAQLDEIYAQWLALLDGLDDAVLDNAARHPAGDMLTVAGLCRRYVDHEVQHAGDIRAALQR